MSSLGFVFVASPYIKRSVCLLETFGERGDLSEICQLYLGQEDPGLHFVLTYIVYVLYSYSYCIVLVGKREEEHLFLGSDM